MRRRKPKLPKWKYAFSCRDCRHVQFIKDEAKGREGDYGFTVTDATERRGEKPEGVAVELADAVIRIADLCGHLGIDLEAAIALKMDYNETRPFKHGKRF